MVFHRLLFGALLVGPGHMMLYAQDAPAAPAQDQTLTQDQLNDLVAPIALYPDPLISQILVAATYPLEVVQAFQWLQRNPGLTGTALTEGAQGQNWDPSVQALVVFQSVLKRLNDDVTWTTNLGNAFLAQQADVMDAIQRMRQKAQAAGKLTSNAQEQVTVSNQGGQQVVEIQPANPEVIYVPDYDPVWIWGPPVYYPYPRWGWGPRPIGGVFFNFGVGISIGGFFGGGWGGWGGWGWHPGWGNHTVIVNNTFIHQYNFNSTHITNVHGTSSWSHDVTHRQGVPYANRNLTEQYRAPARQNLSQPSQNRNQPAQNRAEPSRSTPTERFGNRDVPKSAPTNQNHAFGGTQNGSSARTNSEHGFSSLGPARTGAAPARSAPAPAPRGNPGGGRRR
jgi:hypothetical protein